MTEHLREEDILPYLDARLASAERTRLDEHLSACAPCRARVEEFRALVGLLGEWKAAEPSPGFDAALRARLAGEREAAGGWLVFRPAYAVALAAAVLLAVAVTFWPPSPPEPSTPAPQIVQTQPPVVETPPAVTLTPPAATTQPPQPKTAQPKAGSDELAVLDNPVLLDNYELLTEFDVLFEPAPKDSRKL